MYAKPLLMIGQILQVLNTPKIATVFSSALFTILSPPLPPVSYSHRMCACFDSFRKSTPPHAPVHYGTWRKRQSTLCTSSPSACLGRVLWANPCASERPRRPRLRPLRVKVKLSALTPDRHTVLLWLRPFQGGECSRYRTWPFDNILTDFCLKS